MSRWKDNIKRREWHNNRRKEYLERIKNIKKEFGKCSECGWNIHPEILEFDHFNKEEKLFNFSSGSFSNYSWEKVILPEIQKCRIVCPNCHRWKHHHDKQWFAKQNS